MVAWLHFVLRFVSAFRVGIRNARYTRAGGAAYMRSMTKVA